MRHLGLITISTAILSFGLILGAAPQTAAAGACAKISGVPKKGCITKQDLKGNAVNSGKVKNESLTGEDIKDGSIGPADLSLAPAVVLVPNSNSSHPPIPSGLNRNCDADLSGSIESATCPVVKWNGYTHWAFSYTDNRLSMNIVAYRDFDGSIASQTNKDGARYVVDVAVNRTTGVVTFRGQSGNTVTMTYPVVPPLQP